MFPEGIINAAVGWWADKISNPGIQSNRATDSANVMASLLATTLALDNVPTADQIVVFRETLTDTIKKYGESHNDMWLSVDYHPCKALADAAEKAEIKTLVFPWKTNMLVAHDKVTVSVGHGASLKVIYEE